jgi:ABC-type Na+ transport system ATPase subunit NatA
VEAVGRDVAPVIRVSGLVKKFGGHTAINGLRFAARRGQITSLLVRHCSFTPTLPLLVSALDAIP